jgi:citrate lyase beta subunit
VKLILITNRVDFAAAADHAGIERIMIDLEVEGKAQRQAGRGLFLSDHCRDDISSVRAVLRRATLLVRINPIGPDSDREIDDVIRRGADQIMLPYFHTAAEARRFVTLVNGRARTILLMETRGAVAAASAILDLPGVDELFVGLNDLALSMGCDSLFEPILDGTVDRLARLVNARGLSFGFGGLARLTRLDLPVHPERILAEQVRVGASLGLLGRSFRDGLQPGDLAGEIARLRAAIATWRECNHAAFAGNRMALRGEVRQWRQRQTGRRLPAVIPVQSKSPNSSRELSVPRI